MTAKRGFIALKVEVDKLEINKLVNISTGLINLRRKVDNLNVFNLKTVPVNLKK